MTGIYKITNPLGRIYIGQALNIETRWQQYRRTGGGNQVRLKRSFDKHGIEAHLFEIVVECTKEELNIQERYYQDLYDVLGKKGLNCILTSTRGKSGHLSESVKRKIGSSNKGKLLGKKRSKECIEKRLATRKLNGADERMSLLYTNKIMSEEVRNKINKTMVEKGHKPSQECLRKATEAKCKPILHVESGTVYPSRKAAREVYKGDIDTGIKRGIFKYL